MEIKVQQRNLILDVHTTFLVGGFEYFFIFTPKIGEDEPILTNTFQRGWFNHQLDYVSVHRDEYIGETQRNPRNTV